MKHKQQKVDIDQLQDQRKKKTNNAPHPPKLKTNLQLKWTLCSQSKRLGNLNRKLRPPIGQAGRVHMNTEVIRCAKRHI